MWFLRRNNRFCLSSSVFGIFQLNQQINVVLNLFEVLDAPFVAPTTDVLNNGPLNKGDAITMNEFNRLYLEGLVVRAANLSFQR